MNATAQISSMADLGMGPSAKMLRRFNCDLGCLRPWSLGGTQFGTTYGPSYITLNSGKLNDKGQPIYENRLYSNATALLRKEDWLRIDQEIAWDDKLELQAWADLYGTAPFNFDAMPWPVIQRTIGQAHAEAQLSMDGMRQADRARPVMDVVNLPMPITHSDGSFSLRDILVSDKSGMPLDTVGIRESNRACDELTEKLTLGLLGTYTFGGGTIYGYRNFPYRYTKVLTTPTTSGWTPATLYAELLAAFQTMKDDLFKGPWVLYYSSGWWQYLAQDYSTTYQQGTLLTKLAQIPGLAKMQQVDYLPDFEMILVQINGTNVRGIQGMPKRVVQWQHGSGMEEYYKVMTIRVPELKYNFRQKAPIMHMTGSAGGTTTTTTTTTGTTTP